MQSKLSVSSGEPRVNRSPSRADRGLLPRVNDAAARSFASDNNAGIHPEVLAAIAAANAGHTRAYGDDPYTERAIALLRSAFGGECEAFFVFSGTGANVLALKALTQPHHAVVCAASSHIHRDECGAPERFTGCKLLALPSSDGKLRPSDIEPLLGDLGNEHHAQPRVVSITQASEFGTVYTTEELRGLTDFCHAHGLFVHMDGARLFNAAASLNVPLRALTTDAGIDVVSLGGTKNGLLAAEAVLFADGERASDFKFLRKQAAQLPSKMRFVAAQFSALFEHDLWRKNAACANAMASRLASALAQLPGVSIEKLVQANAVFARLPPAIVAPLARYAYFYSWEDELRTSDARASGTLVRLMASFDTTEADVDAFVAEAQRLLTSRE